MKFTKISIAVCFAILATTAVHAAEKALTGDVAAASRRQIFNPCNRRWRGKPAATSLSAGCVTLAAQQKPYLNDLVENFKAPPENRDYIRRDVMVPMRDGVKLFTVIWIPQGAHDAPIVLTRTCYDAAHRAGTSDANRLIDALPFSDREFVRAGYIRVYQDVRGKYGSEGAYLMTAAAGVGL